MFLYLFHSSPTAATLRCVNQALEGLRDLSRPVTWHKAKCAGRRSVSRLLEQSGTDSPLDDDSLVDNIMLLTAMASRMSTRALHLQSRSCSGTGTCWNLPIERPELFPDAVDECLRFESPGQYQGRITREALEIDGIAIRANSVVLLALASANRDRTPFPIRQVSHRTQGPSPPCLWRGPARLHRRGLGQHGVRGFLRGIRRSLESNAIGTGELDWTARAGHRWPWPCR